MDNYSSYPINIISNPRNEPSGDGSQWAQSLKAKYPNSVEYYLKFGTPLEKRLTQAVVDMADGK